MLFFPQPFHKSFSVSEQAYNLAAELWLAGKPASMLLSEKAATVCTRPNIFDETIKVLALFKGLHWQNCYSSHGFLKQVFGVIKK